MGNFGNILSIRPEKDVHGQLFYGNETFLVEHFPHPANDMGFGFMLGHYDGIYSYTNNLNQVISMKKFDYGTPCEKIWTPEEIANFKKQADDKKKAQADKILKYHQDLANKGDAYGLLRMGEHYRDGDDVPKDLAKARDYLTKAAAAGSQAAAEELIQLSVN